MKNTADLKELIATATARGADVRTTEFEGEIASVHVLRMPGIDPFPMTATVAAKCLRERLACEPA
jgi:hypothetical protein